MNHHLQTILLALLLLIPAAQGWTAEQPPATGELVSRVGRVVDTFLQDFSSVKCTERVTQLRLNEKGKAVASKEADYDYLVIFETAGGAVQFQESRLAMKEPAGKERSSLLVTNGFSALLLVFHSEYQNSFQYELAGSESGAGRNLQRIHFRHVRGMRSPIGLVLKNREFPLGLNGDAWVDEGTGFVTRIQATLSEPLDDIGLRQFQTEVLYSPVKFSGADAPVWLPASAQIQLASAKNQWKNVHRFTDYKLFSVKTETQVTPP